MTITKKNIYSVFFTRKKSFYPLCITASGNILANGNFCFRVFKLQLKVINKNVCYLYHSHKKEHSLEIWVVKLRFPLIYENMLKNTAKARSECTAKEENKASYNTDYIAPDLIDFYADD